MIKREEYLNKLIEVKDINLIKVITGVRRCGKSTLLNQFKDHLLEETQKENIIHINFESGLYFNIKTYEELYNYITSKITSKDKVYILLDEVQNVESWEKAINALNVDINCDIYITGSNAYLLSSELTTLIAGRIYTLHIYPFSFKEYIKQYPFKENISAKEKLNTYIKYGGMPNITNLNNNEDVVINYLTDIKDVVIKKDITNRNQVKDTVFLDNLIYYMASNIGNLTSPNKIHDTIKNMNVFASYDKIDAYLKMLENSYLLYRVPRFELKGKLLLKTQGKYYFVDTGIKNIVNGFTSYNSGSSYENIVYLELLRRGYQVYVGKYNDLEIDFIATKPNKEIYIQVTRNLSSEQVINRETKSLLSIKDNHEKFIITADDIFENNIQGIKVINIVDFLLEDY